MPSIHGQQGGDSSAISRESHLTLLVTLEPRFRGFLENAAGLLLPRDALINQVQLGSSSTAFWPDVFISTPLPWRGILRSGICHVLLVAVIWSLPHLPRRHSQSLSHKFFQNTQLTYYRTADYLPPLHIPAARSRKRQDADPVRARQQIISVPPEPDNHTQTIIAPPDLKIAAELRLPNLVAWTPVPAPVPVPGSLRSQKVISMPAPADVLPPSPEIKRAENAPRITMPQAEVVAPPPEIASASKALHSVTTSETVVVAPAPESAISRQLGTLSITHLQSQVAAPQLPVPEQQVASLHGSSQNSVSSNSAQAAPEAHNLSLGRSSGQFIALGLNPAEVAGPIDIPAGNRRGSFAADPSGKTNASATPESREGGDASAGNGPTVGKERNVGIKIDSPPGRPNQTATQTDGTPVVVTRTPHGAAGTLLASAMMPRSITELARRTAPNTLPDLPESEARVFGPKKLYSMTLNMPNLNSTSGSWVIRFAELNDDGVRGELTAPVATEKVDPAYPAQMMRAGVEGTVTLYAVIRADGAVANIRVLHGADDRLDSYARTALARCHFRPATKNGSAVALEAVVRIPFQARKPTF
jgi:TonB family protein